MTRARPPVGAEEADRLLVVMSDIEMGSGGIIDDFPHSEFLGDLILSYNEPPYDQLAVDLVLNGDTFDLLKTPYLGTHPRHITSDVALGKMMSVSAAHPKFFAAMRRFLSGPHGRRAHFVVGNHDPEILFPEVQQLIRSLCGSVAAVNFPGYDLDFGSVHIEHGSQHDTLFRVDPQLPFVKYQGQDMLNIAWGSAAILDAMMPYQQLLCFHDRLKPKDEVFALLPEVKELLLGQFWRYWTKDYWKDFRSADPTKRISWAMVREVMARFVTQQPDVTIDKSLIKNLAKNDGVRLTLIGHEHHPAWVSYGDRKLLQTGCLRDEFMIVDQGRALRPIPKVYAEVWMRGDEPLCSSLIEVRGPPPLEGHVPKSLFNVLPQVQALLADIKDSGEAEARARQEKREASGT